MSTTDVPGANPANGDALKMGCWAESPAKDALLFVVSTENGRVIFSMFDLAKQPVVEYRDAMSEDEFKRRFTAAKPGGRGRSGIAWIWHDKTPFPWDTVIKQGSQDGARPASAADTIAAGEAVRESTDRIYSDQRSTAERVAEDLHLRGVEILDDEVRNRARRSTPRAMQEFVREMRALLDRHFPEAPPV